MSLLVDTSAWSLLFRRNAPISAEAEFLTRALRGSETVVLTGLVLQELLQGFHGPKAGEAILARTALLPLVVPDRQDHIQAASLRNHCRKNGIQIAAIDALLAQLCIRHGLTMLSADADFQQIARHTPLDLWRP